MSGAGWTVLEVVAWGVGLAVAGRTLIAAPVRRELREKPLVAAVLTVSGVFGLAAAIWLGLAFPPVRRGLALVLLVGTLAAWVRARPSFGSRRGLPPGSLGLTASLVAIDDPSFFRRSSERWGPVFKMRQMHQPVACITDLETGLELFQRERDRLRQSDWAFNRLVQGGYLEYIDGELHTRMRGSFESAYTRGAVEAARPVIREVARSQLAAMAAASDPSGIHPEPYLLPIAQLSLLRMVLGVEASHPDFDELRERFADLNRPLELFFPVPRASHEAYVWLAEKVTELAHELERDHGPRPAGDDSVLSSLAASATPPSSDPAVIGNLVLMIKEGSIMVRGMLRWIIKMLADHPGEVTRIRESAADAAELEARTTAFARETIRLHESPYLYRRVQADVSVGGFRIPRGWLVRLCLTEAHARPDVFDDPERFDPGRHRTGLLTAQQFCPFGSGDRACPGQDIALEIAKNVVRECALGYVLRAVDDGPAWRINRHWGLWRPSLRLRVVLHRRNGVS